MKLGSEVEYGRPRCRLAVMTLEYSSCDYTFEALCSSACSVTRGVSMRVKADCFLSGKTSGWLGTHLGSDSKATVVDESTEVLRFM